MASLYVCVPQVGQDCGQGKNQSPQSHQLSLLLARTPHSYEGRLIPIRISPRVMHSRRFSPVGVRRLTEPRVQLEAICTAGHLNAQIFSVSASARETLSVCQPTDKTSQAVCTLSDTCFVTATDY